MRDKTELIVNERGVQICLKKKGTAAPVSSSFKTFIEWKKYVALLCFIQKSKVRGLVELQLICPVVTRITPMGQTNNADCYITYL